MSCNGCRILRKGCSLDCTLRPCLQWIKSPDSQANATLFLAKFYGRAGLLNLINAGPADLRPEIFRSLLYEACGRIINPVYGSVGLLGSGNWHRCQVAVDSVFQGRPIAAPLDSAAAFHGCDIRHLTKDAAIRIRSQSQSQNLTRLTRHHKRRRVDSTGTDRVDTESEMKFTITGWNYGGQDYERAPSHDMGSVETVEPDLMNRDEPPVRAKPEPVCEIGLDLTLGPSPPWQANGCTFIEISDSES